MYLQLLGGEQLSETCASNKPVCIVAIVPDLLDCNAKCRNNYLSIIGDVAKKFRRQGWGYAHTNSDSDCYSFYNVQYTTYEYISTLIDSLMSC